MSLNGVRKSPQRVNPCVSETLTSVSEMLTTPDATMGETRRWLRNAVRLSQAEVAKRAGIAEGLVSEIENDLTIAKPEQQAALDGALLMEIANLLGGFSVAIKAIQKRRIA